MVYVIIKQFRGLFSRENCQSRSLGKSYYKIRWRTMSVPFCSKFNKGETKFIIIWRIRMLWLWDGMCRNVTCKNLKNFRVSSETTPHLHVTLIWILNHRLHARHRRSMWSWAAGLCKCLLANPIPGLFQCRWRWSRESEGCSWSASARSLATGFDFSCHPLRVGLGLGAFASRA